MTIDIETGVALVSAFAAVAAAMAAYSASFTAKKVLKMQTNLF